MFRKSRILVAVAALALGLGLGVNAGPSGSGHALAAGGGYTEVVQFCQRFPGQYPTPGSSMGGCVSYATANGGTSGNSNAYAPGFCNYIATTYPGNGYGFVFEYYDFSTETVGFLGPLNDQGACVSAITQNIGPNQQIFGVFYP